MSTDTLERRGNYSRKRQVGLKFSKWEVVEIFAGKLCLCVCECGTKRMVSWDNLRNGRTTSCGCFRNELLVERFRLWRLSKPEKKDPKMDPVYRIWKGIKRRCLMKSYKDYKDYGGRGITLCDEWERSFAAFRDYVGERPSPAHSIDRYPNNDGNYEPGNVRWATPKEQSRNTRRNVLISAFGKTATMAEWTEITGLPKSTFRNRIKRSKWDAETAISKKVVS